MRRAGSAGWRSRIRAPRVAERPSPPDPSAGAGADWLSPSTRRASRLPVWVVPTVAGLVAVAALYALNAHFRRVTDERVEAGTAAVSIGQTVAQARLTGTSPITGAAPGIDRSEVAGPSISQNPSAGASPDSSDSAGATQAALDRAVGSVVAEAATPRLIDSDRTLWVDPASSGRSWSELGATEGLLTFRGNPTRTFHGRGPVPTRPQVQWTFDIGCSSSPVAGQPKTWCGSGWTGQPTLFRSPTTGQWVVAFGAYNKAVNFLDPDDGSAALPPYVTGDIIKGTVTIDPDGYPLLYTGSRDNFFHVVALDRDRPEAVWTLSSDAIQPTLWNNDWDASSLVIDDYLIEGGENGRIFVVKLNRGYNDEGRVEVDPEIVFSTESWDQELLQSVGDVEVSVESSVAVSNDVAYFTNSAGLVQGWRIGGLDQGEEPERTFRFWAGDDADASIVVDDEGMLYVTTEYERGTQRARELGQIIKLDPSRPDDPLVWSRAANEGLGSGVWATPALHDDLLIVATNGGEVLGLDRDSGTERWRLALPGPLWSSPVVVDDTLIQGDCDGYLTAFDLTDLTPAGSGSESGAGAGAGRPRQLWSVSLGGCLESTPAVWDGQIFVGSRSGTFYGVSDAGSG